LPPEGILFAARPLFFLPVSLNLLAEAPVAACLNDLARYRPVWLASASGVHSNRYDASPSQRPPATLKLKLRQSELKLDGAAQVDPQISFSRPIRNLL
jgi:hypothetical protein